MTTDGTSGSGDWALPQAAFLPDSGFAPAGAEEGSVFRASGNRQEGDAPPSREAVEEALRTVHDPEIPVNIFDLGLIYQNDIAANGDVRIVMTLTAPACPVAGELPQQVADAVAGVGGVGTVGVTLTWTPSWSQDMMTDDARMILDFF